MTVVLALVPYFTIDHTTINDNPTVPHFIENCIYVEKQKPYFFPFIESFAGIVININ